MNTEIKIDPDFRDLLGPISDEELSLLQKSIDREGCRDPLVVWREKDILLDGHHRHSYCVEHDVVFGVDYISLPDRLSALRWIIDNQAGRRNLSSAQLSLLRAAWFSASGKPRQATADEFGVSPRTVTNDAQFDEAQKKLSGKAKDAALSGKISKRDVIRLAALDEKSIAEIAEKADGRGEWRDEIDKAERAESKDKVSISTIAAPYKRAIEDVNRIRREFREIADDGRLGAFVSQSVVRIEHDLSEVRDTIKANMPVERCSHCDGAGCQRCRHSGFVTFMNLRRD